MYVPEDVFATCEEQITLIRHVPETSRRGLLTTLTEAGREQSHYIGLHLSSDLSGGFEAADCQAFRVYNFLEGMQEVS